MNYFSMFFMGAHMEKDREAVQYDIFRKFGNGNKYLLDLDKSLELDETEETVDSSALQKCRKKIEPWLSALFQSEHLSLLLGSGFTKGLCSIAHTSSAGMEVPSLGSEIVDAKKIKEAAEKQAKELKRENANIEDYIRVIDQLLRSYDILREDDKKEKLEKTKNEILTDLFKSISKSEKDFEESSQKTSEDDNDKSPILYLVSFLLSFASRTATRERLNIFTTNYDRFIEYGADIAGLHILDRFVGFLEPIFRSSKLDLDLHYNPPGIRGEPRYLEGVIRLTKLHGSLDWIAKKELVCRRRLPFGEIPRDSEKFPVVIYPTSLKDKETAFYPYVDLFRDYAAAVCRPNSVLVTYGYGFGDSHLNRVIKDMLTIPSTHLVILSFDDKDKKIETFCKECLRADQLTVLIGSDLASIQNLVDYFLPKPSIDKVSLRENEILRSRKISDEEQKDTIPPHSFVDTSDLESGLKK